MKYIAIAVIFALAGSLTVEASSGNSSCYECEWVADLLQSIVAFDGTKDLVKYEIKSHCADLGKFSLPCKIFVISKFNKDYQKLIDYFDPLYFCTQIGYCVVNGTAPVTEPNANTIRLQAFQERAHALFDPLMNKLKEIKLESKFEKCLALSEVMKVTLDEETPLMEETIDRVYDIMQNQCTEVFASEQL